LPGIPAVELDRDGRVAVHPARAHSDPGALPRARARDGAEERHAARAHGLPRADGRRGGRGAPGAVPHDRRRDLHGRGRIERGDARSGHRGDGDRAHHRAGRPERRPALGRRDGRAQAAGVLLMARAADSAADTRSADRRSDTDLLRLSTAGGVDDGKSTLIGRLLYDTKSIFEDQLEHVEGVSRKLGEETVNLALLTDGLRAEREQKITIDVAYRYFATPKRKFIIADTPGHVQYTRNMVTGASTADLAVILVDARKGVLPQSKRHAFSTSLQGIPHIIVAVNKMDLVGYSEDVFERIRADFQEFSTKLTVSDITYVPVSALAGDNVVERSERMPWYEGGPLLNRLETVSVGGRENRIDFRYPVQYVIRPNQ